MSMVTVHGPNTMYDGEAHEGKPGVPGSFPAGQEVPADLTELRAEVGPFPTEYPWIDGQYVVLVDNSHAYWDGNSWENGLAPSAPAMPEINGTFHALPASGECYWDGTGWADGVAPDAYAIVGDPGTFFPDGYVPADLTALQTDVADQTDRWVDGQHVVLDDASKAHWDGDSWEVGEAPASVINDVQAGIPGKFLPDPYYADLLFANITALRADTFVGTTGSAMVGDAAWTIGQYVLLGNSAHVFWNGTAWATGEAP